MKAKRTVGYSSNYVRLIGTSITELIRNNASSYTFVIEVYDQRDLCQFQIWVRTKDFYPFNDSDANDIVGKQIMVEGKMYGKLPDIAKEAKSQIADMKSVIIAHNIVVLTKDTETRESAISEHLEKKPEIIKERRDYEVLYGKTKHRRTKKTKKAAR